MRHSEYLQFLKAHFLASVGESQFWESLNAHIRELFILTHLNLDPAIDILRSLYAPTPRASPRDPVCMLRSLILMTSKRITGITQWVQETRAQSLLAMLGGFEPGDTPGIGTYYDFFRRLIDGLYRKPCEHRVKTSDFLTGRHQRNLPSEKQARKENTDIHHSQSEKLAADLLASAQESRPDDFPKILEDLLVRVAIKPSIESELFGTLDALIASGDGSILTTAASALGKPSCSCRSQGIFRCSHDRIYTSPTAKWCYDAHKDCFLFGDRYYHLVVHHNGHDLPLLTIMPGGNESDYTLSLKAFDRFLKVARENGLDMHIGVFCGDGHHDSCAHYQYFETKDVIPVIPLSESSKKTFPHLLDDSQIRLDTDGTPLCPAGMRMRHHQYFRTRKVHLYTCPAKRHTHRKGKSLYVLHSGECPRGQDCAPDSSLGPLVTIRTDTDRRLYPPIPRDSKRFKEIMSLRTSTERCNSLIDAYNLEGAHRNASYGLIRLLIANIVEHAVIAYREALKVSSREQLLDQTLIRYCGIYREQYLDTG
jgi:hypothetical protein